MPDFIDICQANFCHLCSITMCYELDFNNKIYWPEINNFMHCLFTYMFDNNHVIFYSILNMFSHLLGFFAYIRQTNKRHFSVRTTSFGLFLCKHWLKCLSSSQGLAFYLHRRQMSRLPQVTKLVNDRANIRTMA